jgi:farnesyl-diphosphate farnesyltransferase
VLLERIEEALSVLTDLDAADQRLIREALQTITSGQELDLTRVAGASAGQIIALETEAELDDYTYRVAGCVGEFWTKMCRARVFPDAPLDDRQLLADGVRFGKGLQLVNILRDLPADLRQGRCYLPSEKLAAVGLKAADLLHSATEPKLRPLYNFYLDQASAHLAAGWDYTNVLPRSCVRVRLACAWPILIGARTLARLRVEPILNPDRRLKISRGEVRGLLARSVLLYPWPGWWRGLFVDSAMKASGCNQPVAMHDHG